MPNVLTEWFEY